MIIKNVQIITKNDHKGLTFILYAKFTNDNTTTMKRLATVLLSFHLASAVLSAGVMEKDFPFVHINRSNSGISYDGISEIFQDSRGFLWIGTFKGLNRYDGERFTVYDKDALGVASDFVHSIEEDGDGNVWVGTDRGVVVYDNRNDSFIPFDIVSDKGTQIDNKVNNIKFKNGKVWLTVNHQGMFCYDIRTRQLVNYFVKDGKQTLSQGIRRFVMDNSGNFWFGLYYNDFYQAEPDLDTLQTVSLVGGATLRMTMSKALLSVQRPDI